MIEFVYDATRHYKGANVEKGFCEERSNTEDVKREECKMRNEKISI